MNFPLQVVLFAFQVATWTNEPPYVLFVIIVFNVNMAIRLIIEWIFYCIVVGVFIGVGILFRIRRGIVVWWIVIGGAGIGMAGLVGLFIGLFMVLYPGFCLPL